MQFNVVKPTTNKVKKPAGGIDFGEPVAKKIKPKMEEQPDLFEPVYNDAHYAEYNKNKDKNLFEEIIEKMMVESCMDETFKPYIEEIREIIGKKLPKHKKRFAILCTLDKNRNLMRKAKVYNNIPVSKMEHIKDYVKILRQYVKVSDVEKKKFGEVMTPIELVTEMLNKLPREVWSNPDLKWLDPCNGVGPFGALVVAGLMKGLANWEPDEEKRFKHIIQNMVYVCELQPKNMFLWMCMMDPRDEHDMNIYCGSFLDAGFDKHMKEVWGIEKFDIIVGNPPYQDSTDTKGKTAATLWPRFIQKGIESCIKVGGYFLFITPISWMSPGNQLIRNRTMPVYFNSNEFLYLNMDCAKYFNKVGSYFSYYLLKIRNKYNEEIKIKIKTSIQTKDGLIEFDFSDLDFIPKPDNKETLSIVSKVFSLKEKIKLNSSSLTRSDKSWVSKIKDDKHIYHIRHTNSEELYSSIKPESFGIKKVILNSTGNFNPTYDDGNKGTSQITRWVEVENEKNGIRFINYLNSKIVQFVLASCRWSGAASKVVFEQIPQIDINRELDDEQLFEYFGLTKEERDIILGK